MLNPAFSTNHMRDITPIFYEVTNRVRLYMTHFFSIINNGLLIKFRNALHEQVGEGPREINVLGWTPRVALELIG